MANEQLSSPTSTPVQLWLARLGLSGRLLVIGGLAGIVAAFLTCVSVSVQMQAPGGANPFGMLGGTGGPTGMNMNKSVMVVEDWRGKVCLVGYVAALVFAFVLYPPNGLGQKTLCWAGVGTGLLTVLLAIWLLVLAFSSGNASMIGMASVTSSPGIGAFLNVVAGGAITAGAYLKAREEKLI